jgi:hypothetical protein
MVTCKYTRSFLNAFNDDPQKFVFAGIITGSNRHVPTIIIPQVIGTIWNKSPYNFGNGIQWRIRTNLPLAFRTGN